MSETRSVAEPAFGETLEQWDRRRRAKLAESSDDPLVGAIVIAHERHIVDGKAYGARTGKSRVIEYDVLVDRRSHDLVAHRYADGSIEWIEPSPSPANQVLAVETVPMPNASARGPGAKSAVRVIDRVSVPPVVETVIDDDGTEREVIRRAPKGY